MLHSCCTLKTHQLLDSMKCIKNILSNVDILMWIVGGFNLTMVCRPSRKILAVVLPEQLAISIIENQILWKWFMWDMGARGGGYWPIWDHTKMLLPAPLGMGAAVKLSSKELKNCIETLCNVIAIIVFSMIFLQIIYWWSSWSPVASFAVKTDAVRRLHKVFHSRTDRLVMNIIGGYLQILNIIKEYLQIFYNAIIDVPLPGRIGWNLLCGKTQESLTIELAAATKDTEILWNDKCILLLISAFHGPLAE